MSILADIAHGKTGAADLFFLLAVILCALAGVIGWVVDKSLVWLLVCAGLASGFLALLLL